MICIQDQAVDSHLILELCKFGGRPITNCGVGWGHRLPCGLWFADTHLGSELGYESPVGERLFGLASFSPPAFYRAGGREEARPFPELDGAGVK